MIESYQLKGPCSSQNTLPGIRTLTRNSLIRASAASEVCWTCPTCRQPLRSTAEHLLQCKQGHTSLRAREGYVHLLPSGRKAPSQAPGDSEAMVRARRALFDAGYYKQVAETVAAAVLDGMPHDGQASVLDAGCGEGTYLNCIHAALVRAGMCCQGFGVDMSKLAVRLAAKRARHLSFAVASSYMLPFQDQVFDAVVSVFAPCPAAEFCRVLKPRGCIVTGSPGRDHLGSIKALIYATPQPFQEDGGVISEADLERCGLRVENVSRLRQELLLQGQDAQHLLAMTPYVWRASREVQQRVAALSELSTMVDIIVTCYRKRS